jgi:riboflavin kinase/FMN adenylyltransferase
MKLIRGTKRIRSNHQGCVATIGNFDGLHLGHQAVIKQVCTKATELGLSATVISFEPLPTEYFSQQLKHPSPRRIYPLRDKARLLYTLGIDEFVCLPFNTALANMEAEVFIEEILLNHLNVKYLVVGDDFCFGRKRRGNFAMLQKIGGDHGMQVNDTSTIEHELERISSTRIRRHLDKGELSHVNHLLGQKYMLSGRVRHGDKRGRTIGFPTLNLRLPDNIATAHGAYAVRIHHLEKQILNGVANIGNRPTFNGSEIRLETHVFDYNGDAYGKYVCIELVKHLRGEQKFAGLDELTAQIHNDMELAKTLLLPKDHI